MTFDRNSTTDDVLAGIDLTGKTAIVTGASGGIGEETARALAAHGADVTIIARSQDKLDAAAQRIEQATGKKVATGTLELHKPDTVKAFALDWLSEHDTLDILINNAGIMMCPYTLTDEGWELQFATNHLGHFLLTNMLMSALRKAGSARVVTVASAGHHVAAVDFEDIHYERRNYDPIDAYGQAKTANIWFASELDRRESGNGIKSFSLHPGGIQTDLGRHLTDEVMADLMQYIKDNGGGGGEGMKTIPQGAATSCWGATSPDLDAHGGEYLVDCQISEADKGLSGRSPWAYDTQGAAKLWDVSNQLLGTSF